MRFLILLKKEIKDIFNIQTIIGLVVSLLAFLMLGSFFSGMSKEMNKNYKNLWIMDKDKSSLSIQAVEHLEKTGFKIKPIEDNLSQDDAIKQVAKDGDKSYLVIEKGFQDDVVKKKIQQEVKVVTQVKSFSSMGSIDYATSRDAVNNINSFLYNYILENNPNVNINPEFLKSPVIASETTYIGNNSAMVSAAALSSFATSQTIFIPIIIFLIISLATQMISTSVANEKNDKTLETLLSTPISRVTMLISKISAAALVAVCMASVLLIGYYSFMQSMPKHDNVTGNILKELGVQLSGSDYVLLGIQLFLTIGIALMLSMIAGALSNDVKSAQTAIMPIMFLTMIPYFVSMFADVSEITGPLKILFYAIPFTHAFAASSNLMFDNTTVFFGGVIYQIIILVVITIVAVRIFSTDKLLTLSFNKLNMKKHKSKVKVK